nr:nicotinate-nucleotide diphosphorylase (carboxylating) [Acidobacteriota bacterium]
MNFLENSDILADIGEFLREDIGRGDITTQATVAENVRGMGKFLAKENLVICGLEVAEAVFAHLDPENPEIETTYNEGDEVEAGTVFATLKG